jgi:NAD(P) transhydrogenase subunit alpha
VAVEAGAGAGASIGDAAYTEAGAEIAKDSAAALAGAGVVFAVQLPDPAILPKGALVVCISGAMADKQVLGPFAAAGVTLAAMELLPRITRAQSMDVLSSQANLAGYRAVIEGAYAFDRGFPMMMTAAGTVPPARVFVMGAGVAGLQAIATARRLGAIVSATDVRPAAKEEIKSLGASFIGVEDAETAGQTGAYAKEMSAEFRQKQAELIAATVATNDMVSCTALVQGGSAPTLVTQAMVDAMRPGSVIVDLASDGGGNCAATRPGEAYTTANGVRILGYRNWPARIGVAASTLYAKNLLTFLSTFWDKDAKAPKLPPDDAIVQGVLVTRDGAVIHRAFVEVVVGPTEPTKPASSPPKVQADVSPTAVPEPTAPAPAHVSEVTPADTPPQSEAPPPAPSATEPEPNIQSESPFRPVENEATPENSLALREAAPPEPPRGADPVAADIGKPASPKAVARKQVDQSTATAKATPAKAPSLAPSSRQKPDEVPAKPRPKSAVPTEKPKPPPARRAPDKSGEAE